MGVQVNAIVSGIPDSYRLISKTITFDGTSGLGAIGTGTIFTVTGEIFVYALSCVCLTNIGVDGGTGAASMQYGTSSVTNNIVATTLATDIDADEFWMDAGPDLGLRFVPTTNKELAISENIVFEVTSTGTQKVTSGVLRFDLYWLPLSSDANVT